MNAKKWIGFRFSSGPDTGEDYKKFQSEAKADLKKQASNAGFELYRFLPHHYEFSAVLMHKKTGKFVYVSIDDVRYHPEAWYSAVLIRPMAHAEDWHGGSNRYCMWQDIGNTATRIIANS